MKRRKQQNKSDNDGCQTLNAFFANSFKNDNIILVSTHARLTNCQSELWMGMYIVL